MCGIVGTVARPGRFNHADIARAARTLAHRGPDDLGVERVGSLEHWEVWFGHARLSILDLSSAGHQPMVCADRNARRGAIVFNGELYNHRELREDLHALHAFVSTSDTEVLLAGLMRHGVAFLERANAMMAAAFWNDDDATLCLMRDRLGKKPLYVFEGAEVIAFASELKAFHALGLPLVEDAEAWAYYHWLRHVPGEKTIYEHCRKLPAASAATISLKSATLPPLRPSLYWDPLAACGRRFEGSYDDAIDELLGLLDDATRIRLDADVPVGVFLSAGIDSSLVASSIAKQHGSEMTAFIVKAADPAFDESVVASQTASRLGLRSHVLDLRLADYARQTSRVACFYDEPCAPLSQIPTMAIAEAAREHVAVVLTGDGGDEIFVGYPWFAHPERLFRFRRPLDFVPAGRLLAGRVLPSPIGRAALRAAVRALGLNEANLDHKQRIAAQLLRAQRPADLYDHFQELRPRDDLSPEDRRQLGPRGLMARAKQWYPQYAWDAAERRSTPELLAALELVTSMRDEILVKVDRGTMAYSLEARSPLLDYRIVELGLSLPLQHKMHRGVFKRVLRDACARRIDPELAKRKKSGFGIPAPADMPPGPSDAVRWSLAVERAWRARWSRSSAEAIACP